MVTFCPACNLPVPEGGCIHLGGEALALLAGKHVIRLDGSWARRQSDGTRVLAQAVIIEPNGVRLRGTRLTRSGRQTVPGAWTDDI